MPANVKSLCQVNVQGQRSPSDLVQKPTVIDCMHRGCYCAFVHLNLITVKSFSVRAALGAHNIVGASFDLNGVTQGSPNNPSAARTNQSVKSNYRAAYLRSLVCRWDSVLWNNSVIKRHIQATQLSSRERHFRGQSM